MAMERSKGEIVERLKNFVINKLETEFEITHFVAEREVGPLGWWEYIQKLTDDISLGRLSEDDAKRQLNDAIFRAYPNAIPRSRAQGHETQVGTPGEDEETVIISNEFYHYYYLPDRTTLIIDALSKHWSEIVTGGLYSFFDNHPEFGIDIPTRRLQNDFVKIAHGVFMAQRKQKAKNSKPILYKEDIITIPPFDKFLLECIFIDGVASEGSKKFLRERYEEQYESEMRLYGIDDRPRNADEFVTSFIEWLPYHFPKIRR
jgi:hypothetical protein